MLKALYFHLRNTTRALANEKRLPRSPSVHNIYIGSEADNIRKSLRAQAGKAKRRIINNNNTQQQTRAARKYSAGSPSMQQNGEPSAIGKRADIIIEQNSSAQYQHVRQRLPDPIVVDRVMEREKTKHHEVSRTSGHRPAHYLPNSTTHLNDLAVWQRVGGWGPLAVRAITRSIPVVS